MPTKTIELSQSIYELCTAHPEIIEVMQALGFTDIVKPGMLNTAGRIMTLPLGSKMKGIDLDVVVAMLTERGFTVVR